MEGWRWIFLVEGLITLFIGIIFTLFVPPAAGDGRPLIAMGRWSYFTERESHIIRNRVLLGRSSQGSWPYPDHQVGYLEDYQGAKNHAACALDFDFNVWVPGFDSVYSQHD